MCVCQKEDTNLDHTKEHSKKPPEEKQFFTTRGRSHPSTYVLNVVNNFTPFQGEDHTRLENYQSQREDLTGLMVETSVQSVLAVSSNLRLGCNDHHHRWSGRKRHNYSCQDPVGKTSNPIPISRRNISLDGR